MNATTKAQNLTTPATASGDHENAMAHIRSLLELIGETAMDAPASEQGKLLTLVRCVERELDDLQFAYGVLADAAIESMH